VGTSYTIVVDSTTDLTPELAEKWGLTVIPYLFTLDGKDYYNHLDYRELSSKDFYDTLRDGKLASTTLVTIPRYMEVWEPILKEGKDILYMCLSSNLSKSYEQSVMAAREAMEAYPDRKVIAIDSKSASLGQGLLAYYAAKARDEGKGLGENAAYIEEIITKLHHWVVPDDLHHMRRGGRVSATKAFVGTMLNVKPVLTVNHEGRIIPVGKARGWSKAIVDLVGRMDEYKMSPKDQTVIIAHSDAPDKAQQLADAMKEKYNGIEIITIGIGPVIGTHTGPGTVAVAFLGNERAKV